MPGNLLTKYGVNNQAITITLANGTVGLASSTTGVGRASTAVDNTTNTFVDALVSVKLKTGSSGTSTTGYATVYAYGTTDGGTTYTEGATGTDAGITLTQPTNAKPIGVLNLVANATTYAAGPFSVAKAFDGILPDHWGVIIVNSSGGALDITAASHLVTYQGVEGQYT